MHCTFLIVLLWSIQRFSWSESLNLLIDLSMLLLVVILGLLRLLRIVKYINIEKMETKKEKL